MNTIVCKSKFSFENFGEFFTYQNQLLLIYLENHKLCIKTRPLGGGGELAPKEVKRRMFFHKFLKFLPKCDHTPKKEFVRCKSGFLPDFLRFWEFSNKLLPPTLKSLLGWFATSATSPKWGGVGREGGNQNTRPIKTIFLTFENRDYTWLLRNQPLENHDYICRWKNHLRNTIRLLRCQF